ncbi:MAG: hypothetical protein JO313_06020 [Verrucomicrobia bacterium]|nr:hypothetical protein [Verrucomicrobiota bacterium]
MTHIGFSVAGQPGTLARAGDPFLDFSRLGYHAGHCYRRGLVMVDANLNLDAQESIKAQEGVPSPDQIETAGFQVTERDIVFECPNCGGELAIDMDGAGMEVDCAHCGAALIVPEYRGPSLQFLQAATSKLAKAIQAARNASPKKFHFEGRTPDDLNRRQNELQQALRESQTQLMEIKGHIHHATIQLHRYQLKLEVIQESQSELQAELEAIVQALHQT